MFTLLLQDKRKALELFQKAADKGSAEGHYWLGYMYYSKTLCVKGGRGN
jgi:TPR repeat protein